MANLSLTLQCNRTCSYCFARAIASDNAQGPLRSETFAEVMTFLERSRVREVRFLGGEPTLHPKLLAFVETALSRGLRAMVFSNGLMPEALAASLASTAPDKVAVLVNVNAPARTDAGEHRRLRRTLEILGTRAQVGHNIVDPATDLRFLLDLVEAHGLRRAIRLGLAHPCVGAENEFLHPRRYLAAGLCIAALHVHAVRCGIRLEPDCGFVPCMFPEGFLDEALGFGRSVGLQCGPVPDILPDGTLVACYPLSRLWRLRLADYESTDHAKQALDARARPLREIGIHAACQYCRLRSAGACLGGCLAASLRRLRTGGRQSLLSALGAGDN